MSTKALERHLAPFVSILKQDGVTEVCINRPNEVYVECKGRFIRHVIDELDYDFLESLTVLIAEFNNKEFPVPLLSGSLPTGERIQIVMNPACEKGKLIISIRRQQLRDMRLEDFNTSGAFKSNHSVNNLDAKLKDLYFKNDISNFVKLAIQAKKNILISGGTGTGKTTFLNACLKCIPKNERLITVEDTREIVLNQPNAAHLLFNENDERIKALDIFKVCLRLRPDRIFLSELRGEEVWPYLRAANSGHPGTLSTVHADSPESAITQLVFMMQQAGSTSTDDRIREYINSIIQVIIQLKRDPNPN